ncbi:hypothetical protein [Caulobacter sp.]|uniref:hypothetical protein n=1 Tax=Caulobacter sp. TaxID=78 RepID=UPI001B1429CD|nr:hypothetical protein [Caulobacter sp.]MBO9544372.1 hypothetical protein [Caulobacter sp.]
MTVLRDFHPSADTVLVAAALLGLILLAVLLVFFEPRATAKDIMLVIIGALATFLTRTGPRAASPETTVTTEKA